MILSNLGHPVQNFIGRFHSVFRDLLNHLRVSELVWVEVEMYLVIGKIYNIAYPLFKISSKSKVYISPDPLRHLKCAQINTHKLFLELQNRFIKKTEN